MENQPILFHKVFCLVKATYIKNIYINFLYKSVASITNDK